MMDGEGRGAGGILGGEWGGGGGKCTASTILVQYHNTVSCTVAIQYCFLHSADTILFPAQY